MQAFVCSVLHTSSGCYIHRTTALHCFTWFDISFFSENLYPWYASCLVKSFLLMIFNAGNLFNVLLISIDRYLSIRFPFKYRDIVTLRRTLFVICTLWSYFAIIMSVTFIFGHIPPTANICDITYVVHPYLYYLVILPHFVIIAIAMVTFYILVWVQVRKQKKQITGTTDSSKKSSIKLTKSLILVVGIFLALYMPTIFCYLLLMVLAAKSCHLLL